jgi:hypothetical protein
LLLAVDSLPPDEADSVAAIAAATGLAAAEVRMRLFGGALPRILYADADDAALEGACQALAAAGIGAFTLDPRAVPSDGDRVIARRLAEQVRGIQVRSGVGAETTHACPAEHVGLLQRGVRTFTTTDVVENVLRTFSAARALATSGLSVTAKTQERETRRRAHEERLVLIHREDGEPDVMLYEHQLDYGFLGRAFSPSSAQNFELLWQWLCARLPRAERDERMAAPGFATTLPAAGVDRVDLGLYLIWLSRLRARGG